jgi:adenine-specific DNA methylase
MQSLHSGSVDLVLTDPPFYHDNLEYDRLAAFYSSWADSHNISNGVPLQVASGDGQFALRLAAIFRECARVLKSDGLMAFTFAHAHQDGWGALEAALKASDLSVTAGIPVEAEGSNGFHNYPGNLKWNGLFVCRKKGSNVGFDPTPLTQAARSRSVSKADQLNLDRALAVAVRNSQSGGR